MHAAAQNLFDVGKEVVAAVVAVVTTAIGAVSATVAFTWNARGYTDEIAKQLALIQQQLTQIKEAHTTMLEDIRELREAAFKKP